ncbi:glycosyl transferase group 1 [Ectothiorhodospira sp. PHS-1]|uniref:hypothetical protein n=1 Tax=Ectothiorhodospira sp. PHS-1 TaxID=519989 RepID=UPI00024A862B|nr:glycosyl transferase group 1 [Ectothiorhodospira sp. PHS-1]
MNDTTRPALLYLVHRIPYPPNKGDKIRSFNLLKHLAGRYRIHLGAFVDDPHDWRYREDVARLCESTCLLPLRPPLAKLASLRVCHGPWPWDSWPRAWAPWCSSTGPVCRSW